MASLVPDKPVSLLLAQKDEEDEPKKQSKEEYKKAKELDEARKAGTAPAEVDEEGKDINPHIPNYISRVPWYYGADQPTLKHQRPLYAQKIVSVPVELVPKKGIIENKSATHYRKGACENCGAITHKKKDCLERPRKIGAKFSGEFIAPDEYIPDQSETAYDTKRDRWAGYDSSTHKRVIEEYAKVEEMKRLLKAKKLQQDLMKAETVEEEEEIKSKLKKVEEGVELGVELAALSDEEEELKYAEGAAMPGTKFEIKERITVRNLRIREDVAKYLRNLDPNSAFYDPKTRSMRDNPYAPLGKGPEDVDYAGDNFVRASGASVQHSRSQLFAWDMVDKGADVHLQAEPTKLELLNKEYVERREEVKGGSREVILEKYGGREHVEGVPPRDLLLAQSEHYIEYSRTGAVIKGEEKAVARSRYEEDVYINNHTNVWGSYYKDSKWGYKCCHSFIKQSYCTGDALKSNGGVGSDDMLALMSHASGASAASVNQGSLALTQIEEGEEQLGREKKKKKKKEKKNKKEKKKRRKRKVSSSSSSESEGGEEGELDRKKLKKALRDEDERRKVVKVDEREVEFNSLKEVKAPTEEEIEAFRMKRLRGDDPMAHLFR